MCGIAGAIGTHAHETVAAMVEAMAHRGPDGEGLVHHERARVSLGSTRLALLDDAGGGQPWSLGEGASLVFNGELYNHPELAAALSAAGSPPPRSSCDTETLARGWRLLGSKLWAQLDGMFAAAIVDKDELILARDPHGQKPLFLWRDPGGRALVFASELAALVAEPRLARALDPRVLVELGAVGFPLADDALLAEIEPLPPGHELRVRVGPDGRLRSTLRDYRDPLALGRDGRLPDPCLGAATIEDPVDALVELLPRVVASHARADHPVGLFLSGGLDSGLLAALLIEHAGAEVHTFTLADDPEHPDLIAARALAERLGTTHHERVVEVDEVEAAWPVAVAVQGLPTAPTVAELGGAWARRWVKAALVGDGADELFAGYRYHQVPRRTIGSMAAGYNRMVRQGAVPRGAGDRLLAQFQTFKAAELESRREGGQVHAPAEALMRLLAEDRLVVNHLRRWDHGALAHSLEVRLPYLSRAITSVARRLPWPELIRGEGGRPGPGKAPLHAAARRLLGEPLWQAIVERPKIAAPSALARARAQLNERCRGWMPPGHRERHPLAAYVLDEVGLVSLDLFVALYLVPELDPRRPALPMERARSLRVARLYADHKEALDAYWSAYAGARERSGTRRAPLPAPPPAAADMTRELLHARWTRGADRYADAALELETYTASNALLAEVADLRPGMSVLDLACGTGATSRAAFARQGQLRRVFAVDWSAEMLAEARRVLAGLPVSFYQARAGELAPVLDPELGEARIDRVLCNAALFQFSDYAGVLADLARLLAPDGILAFTIPEPSEGKAVAEVLGRHGLYPLRPSPGSTPRGPRGPRGVRRGPPRQPSFEERVAATEAAGWRVLSTRTCTLDMDPEEHVRWLLLPMFRHPSWSGVSDQDLRPRLLEALRSEGERYPVAWRAVVVAPR